MAGLVPADTLKDYIKKEIGNKMPTTFTPKTIGLKNCQL